LMLRLGQPHLPSPSCDALEATLELTSAWDQPDAINDDGSKSPGSMGFGMVLHVHAWSLPADVVLGMSEPLAAMAREFPRTWPTVMSVEYDINRPHPTNLIAQRNPCVWRGVDSQHGGHCESRPPRGEEACLGGAHSAPQHSSPRTRPCETSVVRSGLLSTPRRSCLGGGGPGSRDAEDVAASHQLSPSPTRLLTIRSPGRRDPSTRQLPPAVHRARGAGHRQALSRAADRRRRHGAAR